MPLVVIQDQFDIKPGLPRFHPEPKLLAVIRQALDALPDTQLVQEARNLLLNDSAFAHVVDERLRYAVADDLRLPLVELLDAEPEMKFACDDDRVAVVSDPLANEARRQLIPSDWVQIVKALVKFMLSNVAQCI